MLRFERGGAIHVRSHVLRGLFDYLAQIGDLRIAFAECAIRRGAPRVRVDQLGVQFERGSVIGDGLDELVAACVDRPATDIRVCQLRIEFDGVREIGERVVESQLVAFDFAAPEQSARGLGIARERGIIVEKGLTEISDLMIRLGASQIRGA